MRHELPVQTGTKQASGPPYLRVRIPETSCDAHAEAVKARARAVAGPAGIVESPAGGALHECGDCGRQWTGTREAHCASCHRHFGGDRAFDMHQRLDHGPCARHPKNRRLPHRVCYAVNVCRDPATLIKADGSPRLILTEPRFGKTWSQPGSRPDLWPAAEA